eukprot:32597_1
MALSKYLNMFECGMNYGEEPKAIDHHDAIYPPLSLDHSNLIEVLKMRSKSLVQSTTFDESTLMHSVNLIQRVAVQRTNHFADQINTQPPITLRRINDDSYLFPQPKSMDFTYNIIWISFGVLAQARIIWRKYGAIYGYLSFVCAIHWYSVVGKANVYVIDCIYCLHVLLMILSPFRDGLLIKI